MLLRRWISVSIWRARQYPATSELFGSQDANVALEKYHGIVVVVVVSQVVGDALRDFFVTDDFDADIAARGPARVANPAVPGAPGVRDRVTGCAEPFENLAKLDLEYCFGDYRDQSPAIIRHGLILPTDAAQWLSSNKLVFPRIY
jgi:hypothetical protein